MPVDDVTEDYAGIDYRDEVDPQSMIESGAAVRLFDVTFRGKDDPAAKAALAVADSRIPKKWDPYPGDDWMFVKSRNAMPGNGSMNWKVVVNYISISNPLEAEWEISWDYLITNEPIDRDINGKAITNSAGETPDPAMTEEVHDLVLRIGRNEDHYDPLLAHAYSGAINSDWFFGFKPGFVKCAFIKAPRARAADLIYYRVQYELHFRLRPAIPGVPEIGWVRRFLDEGLRTRAADGTVTVIKDSEGNQLSQPSLLNGFGQLLADGADAVFLQYQTRRQLPFSVLNLA